jgi:hypothetical protein
MQVEIGDARNAPAPRRGPSPATVKRASRNGERLWNAPGGLAVDAILAVIGDGGDALPTSGPREAPSTHRMMPSGPVSQRNSSARATRRRAPRFPRDASGRPRSAPPARGSGSAPRGPRRRGARRAGGAAPPVLREHRCPARSRSTRSRPSARTTAGRQSRGGGARMRAPVGDSAGSRRDPFLAAEPRAAEQRAPPPPDGPRRKKASRSGSMRSPASAAAVRSRSRQRHFARCSRRKAYAPPGPARRRRRGGPGRADRRAGATAPRAARAGPPAARAPSRSCRRTASLKLPYAPNLKEPGPALATLAAVALPGKGGGGRVT